MIDPALIGDTFELAEARRAAVDGDRAFKRAMLAARITGTERFSIGVDARPGTQNPMAMPRPLQRSNGSPAAACADLGASLGRLS
jgi:hypothetical protein